MTVKLNNPSLVGVPYSVRALRENQPDGEDLVIFDNLQAGNGARVGFSEGGEGAACEPHRAVVSDR